MKASLLLEVMMEKREFEGYLGVISLGISGLWMFGGHMEDASFRVEDRVKGLSIAN